MESTKFGRILCTILFILGLGISTICMDLRLSSQAELDKMGKIAKTEWQQKQEAKPPS